MTNGIKPRMVKSKMSVCTCSSKDKKRIMIKDKNITIMYCQNCFKKIEGKRK